ncbi:MAG: hypothetical protein U0931_20960 [Vulcanimicrobiota bacterium]
MKRGVTLVESVIACFLLGSSLMLIVNLIGVSVRQAGRIEQRTLAALIARERLTRLQTLAQDPNAWDSLAAQTGRSQDPAHPDFEVAVAVYPCHTYSPCYQWSAWLPPDQQKPLNQTLKTLEVEVFARGQSQLRLVSRVSEPGRGWHPQPLRVSEGPHDDPLAFQGGVDFSVEARDALDRPIPDLSYRWYVVPLNGNGTITQSGDGRQARFINRIRTPAGGFVATGGTVGIEVSARYQGVERRARVNLRLRRSP